METWTQLALVLALVVILVQSLGQLIYFARTTWEAQRRNAELQRTCISARLAEHPSTASMATVLGSQPPDYGDSMLGSAGMDHATGRRRLVRVPLATPNGVDGAEPVFDDDGMLIG